MKTDTILQADVLDIVFENRNKKYGAYTLRKFYNNRLYKSMGATFMLAVVLCSFSFLKKDKVAGQVYYTDTVRFASVPVDKPPVPEKPKEIQQPQKPVVAKPAVSTKAYTKVKITNDPVTAPIENLDPNDYIGTKTVKVEGGSPKVPVIPVVPGIPELTPDPPVVPVDILTPVAVAEVMPSYPGGMEALKRFLQKNLTNPQDLEEGQTISVKIRFVVGYDGVLKGFETIEDGGAVFNNEVLRVLKKMPHWIPGKSRGENVSVYYVIPVKFTPAE